MKRQLSMDINVGIGDHLFLRVFLDGVKDQYDRIAITHSKPGMKFWHKDDPKRWAFNLKLGELVFSESPYILVPNAFHYPFFPNERIVKDINNKPVRPNIKDLCKGTSLSIGKYIVLTTKVRHIKQSDFEQLKSKVTPALQKLAETYTMVISGEREVEKSIEYNAECNRDNVYGLYNYYKEILPPEKTLDLSIPALGITCSDLTQLQQDCLIMKEAEATITFGIGGNLWISACAANKTIAFRNDKEPTTDLVHGNLQDLHITKNIDEFISYLNTI